MMEIYTIIEFIKLSEQRGVELLIDALIIGVEIGRRNIEDQKQILQLVEQFTQFKRKIDLNIYSPFLRDEIFDRVLNKKEKLDDILYKLQIEFQRQSKMKQIENICELCNQGINNQNDKFYAECKHQFHKCCVLIQGMENQNCFKCPLCGFTTLQQDIERQIKDNKNIKKSCCPTPQCSKYFSYVGQEIYRCTECGKKYCLKCQQQSHTILQCNNSIKTIKFQMGDHYKECPRCKQWVKKLNEEKILQCSCKYNFCFGCGQKEGTCICNKNTGGIFQKLSWIKRKIIG